MVSTSGTLSTTEACIRQPTKSLEEVQECSWRSILHLKLGFPGAASLRETEPEPPSEATLGLLMFGNHVRWEVFAVLSCYNLGCCILQRQLTD